MDFSVVEYGSVFSSLRAVVTAYSNIPPFTRGMLVEKRVDIDKLAMEYFLKRYDTMRRRMELETRN
jgi:hypothetical protein